MAAALVRRLAVLAAGLTAAASLTVAPASAAGTGTVQGRITDERGAPSSSQIRLSRTDGSDTLYSFSEADGSFTIPDVPVGRYRFGYSDNAHPPQYAHNTDSYDAATLIDVAEGQVVTLAEQYLPLARLVVTVVDRTTGKPVAGACALTTTTPSPTACAGANGIVTVTGVWPGTSDVYVFDGNGAHWPTTVEGVSVERGRATRIRVTLDPAAAITTTVRDATTHRPVAACVRLVSGHGQLAGGDGCYYPDEATGRLVIGPLAATTGQLFVDPQDGTHGALWVARSGGTGDQRQARVVTAAVGRPVSLPAIDVGPAGTISGTVRDRATGQPVYQMCAYPYAFDPALGTDFGPRCSTTAGTYTISGLGAYAWPVLFTSAPIYGYAWQWSGDVADRFAARTVQVRPGRTTTLDARVVTGGTVTGTVVDAAGTPQYAYASAYNARTGDFAAWNASSDGPGTSFVVKGLATQQVKLNYRAAGDCWYLNKRTFATATKLPVTAGAATGPLMLLDCGQGT